MTANDDRLCPARYGTRDILEDDRLAEYGAIEDVPDCTVRGFPHLFEVEFLDTVFVRCDCRAFDSDVVLLDGVRRVDRDLVVCRVAVFQSEIVVLDGDVYVGQDELVVELANSRQVDGRQDEPPRGSSSR
jgi:hypothetical protein